MNLIQILDRINSYVWGWGLICLLLFTGVFYTIKLKFIQFRLFPFLIKSIFKKKNVKEKSENGISQLKTVTSSLGTAMGTGNIIGVSTALAIGGEGAVFWMWVSAFLGMALVYAENCLSIIYRRNESGQWLGGPVSYLKYGVGSKSLSVIFALFCIFASLGMGGMVQANSIGNEISGNFKINKIIVALCIFIAVSVVITGGIKRIGSASQFIIPILTAVYIVISVVIIIRFRENIPDAFKKIFKSAFDFNAVSGGTVGTAISVGIRRGIFSNEAGLGSSPIMHGASEDGEPSVQGMWSIFEVFLDTIICCTLTALVLIVSNTDDITLAFSSVLGANSNIFITVAISLFAFCTITGWYYCGETSFRYLSKGRYIRGFSLIFSVVVAMGAVFSLEVVWCISDIFNGLMAIPNILALIILFPKVKTEKTYKQK